MTPPTDDQAPLGVPDNAVTPPAKPEVISGGISLGRWGGVPLRAHWSALLTLVLFGEVLATATLPLTRPGHGSIAYWVAGILTAAVFLVTVLTHELAHAIVATHYDVRVKRITLWMLGGFTELDGEAPTPRAETLIALAGPATSFGLGISSLLFATQIDTSGLLGASVQWLGEVSIVLAVFNLLPGAPLDGGRVLLGVLWARFHDRSRATVAAGRAGRVLGGALIGLGLFALLGGVITGLWLAFIGWFILSSATAEMLHAQHQGLSHLHADQLISSPAEPVPDWWSVAQYLDLHAVEELQAQDVIPLVSLEGRLTGLTTLRALRRVSASRREVTRLREVSTKRIVTVTDTAPISDVVMSQLAHGGIAVVIDAAGHPLGVINKADLARKLGSPTQ